MSFSLFVERLLGYANDIVLVLIGIGLIVFLAGLLKYVAAGNDPNERKEGRNVIIWGIIGLSVMIGVWGFVNIVANVIAETAGGGGYYAPNSGGTIYVPGSGSGRNDGYFPEGQIEGDVPIPTDQFPV